MVDEETLAEYAVYRANSRLRTQVGTTKPNPWGLYDMLGNVREFCRDFYEPDAYARPAGAEPREGREHAVRGGSFKSDPVGLRCGARDRTRHDAWLRTDPQTPKSVWWYSDCTDVGFRVVREYEPE